MMMPKQVVLEWTAAFNRHDAAAMAALYHDDSMNLQLPHDEPARERQACLILSPRSFARSPRPRVVFGVA
jgi:hypothetical protein